MKRGESYYTVLDICRHYLALKWRIFSQTSTEGSGKNWKSGFFLLGLKYTLRTCFDAINFLPNPVLSWAIFKFHARVQKCHFGNFSILAKFIFETKPFSRQLQNYTNIRRSMLKKSLKDYDFQTIQKLAYCASFCHRKAVEACIPFKKPHPLEPKGFTLFYYVYSFWRKT